MRQPEITAVSIFLAALVLGGCDWNALNGGGIPEIGPSKPVPACDGYLTKTAVRDETQSDATSAVDTALEWARKYAEASERHNKLLQENRSLNQQNQEYQKQVTELQGKIERAERELAEANSMLLEMRQELDKWKTDVLGFRDEMRRAQKVQLDALAKILKLVGGELTVPQEVRTNDGAAGAKESGDRL